MRLGPALFLTLLACASGCGMLFRGATQKVAIECDVPGVRLEVDDVPITTGTILLARSEEHVVTAEAPGYYPAALPISRRLSAPIVALDVSVFLVSCLGGLAALLADDDTGAWYDLVPERVVVVLVRRGERW